jgi:hypothetical protein
MFWHPEWFRGTGRSKWYGDGKPTKRNFISSIIFMVFTDNPLELPVNGFTILELPIPAAHTQALDSLASVV